MPAGFPVVGPEWPSMNSLLLGDERVQTSPEVALGGMPRPTDQREIKCGVKAGLRGDDRGNRVDDPPRTRRDRRIVVIAQRAGLTDVHHKRWFADDLYPVGPAFLWYVSASHIEILGSPLQFGGIGDLIDLDVQAGGHCADG